MTNSGTQDGQNSRKSNMDRHKIFSLVNRELRSLFPAIRTALHYSNPWELLVATILSAQTTDKTVNEITSSLFKKYPTLEDYKNADLEEFRKDIRRSNYHQNKARFILEDARIISERFGGKVPDTMEELLELKGVARKTANIVLSNAYGKHEGIAVDTHVKRLSKLFGLTDHTDPAKIEKDLMEVVPKEEWKDFSLRLIEYGRQYCPARPHEHEKCPLTRKLRATRPS